MADSQIMKFWICNSAIRISKRMATGNSNTYDPSSRSIQSFYLHGISPHPILWIEERIIVVADCPYHIGSIQSHGISFDIISKPLNSFLSLPVILQNQTVWLGFSWGQRPVKCWGDLHCVILLLLLDFFNLVQYSISIPQHLISGNPGSLLQLFDLPDLVHELAPSIDILPHGINQAVRNVTVSSCGWNMLSNTFQPTDLLLKLYIGDPQSFSSFLVTSIHGISDISRQPYKLSMNLMQGPALFIFLIHPTRSTRWIKPRNILPPLPGFLLFLLSSFLDHLLFPGNPLSPSFCQLFLLCHLVVTWLLSDDELSFFFLLLPPNLPVS